MTIDQSNLPPGGVTPLTEDRIATRQRLKADWNFRPDLHERVYSGTRLYVEIMRLKIPNTKPAQYWHPDRVQKYTLCQQKERPADPDEDDEDEEPDDRNYFRPVEGEIVPKLQAVVSFADSDAPAGQRTCYLVAVNDKEALISYEDLQKGICWERWPGTGVATPRQKAEHFSIVDTQCRRGLFADQIPTHAGRRATGWETREDGTHALILPHGRLWGATGEIAGARAHLLISPKHIDPYLDLTIDASKEAQSAALAFVSTISRRSIASLELLTDLRSIMYDIWHSDFSVLARGPSGRGKTSLDNKLRNLTGRFAWNAPGTATFTSTSARIEYEAGQIKSLAVLIDDLAIIEGMAERDKQARGQTLESILRSVGNDESVRGRMTAKMQEQIAHKLDCCPILTCEQLLPDLAQSALNRAIILEIGEGEIDKAALVADGTAHDDGLRGVGYGFISYLARLWDSAGVALADSWRALHTKLRADLFEKILDARHGDPIPDEASRLPSNGAHLLLAAHVLIDYCAAEGIACPFTLDGLTADLVMHLCKQMDTITELIGGGDGRPLSDKVLEALRIALTEHNAYLEGRGHALLTPDDMPEGYTLANMGMQHMGDTTYVPPTKAPVIGMLDKKLGYVCLCSETAHRLLNQRYLKPCPTARQCWEALDKKGLIARESERQRSRKLDGQRYIWLKLSALFPDDDPPDEADPPSAGDPAMPSDSPAPASPDVLEQIIFADVTTTPAAPASSHAPPPHGALCPNCGCDPNYRTSEYQLSIGGYPWYCNGCGIFYDTALSIREERIASQKGSHT